MPADQPQRPRAARIMCLTGVALGIATVVGGLLWSAYAKPQHVWSPQQAAEYTAANRAAHAAISGHVEGDRAAQPKEPDPAAVAAALERFDRIQGELESARFTQNRLGPLLVGIGLAVTAAFGVGYLLARGDQS